MRYQWLIIMASMLVSAPSFAVCPAHEPTFVPSALSTGGFKVCVPDVDVDGDPAPASFYQSVTVSAVWGTTGTASVVLTTVTPGTPMLVSFPAAKGAGSATAFATNQDGVNGVSATSAVTFRRGHPAKPGMSK